MIVLIIVIWTLVAFPLAILVGKYLKSRNAEHVSLDIDQEDDADTKSVFEVDRTCDACSTPLEGENHHQIVDRAIDDSEADIRKNGGGTAMVADYCSEHCTGGCNRGCAETMGAGRESAISGRHDVDPDMGRADAGHSDESPDPSEKVFLRRGNSGIEEVRRPQGT